jgi:hypothetical protein
MQSTLQSLRHRPYQRDQRNGLLSDERLQTGLLKDQPHVQNFGAKL